MCGITLIHMGITNQSAVGSLQLAVALAMDIYYVRKKFPKDKFYSLTTQTRKSTRYVC